MTRIRFGARPCRKYGNVPTVSADGRKFASQREAARYAQLLLLVAHGSVRELACQVPYRLEVNGQLVCKYIADFEYEELRKGEWHKITEDCKGFRTRVYSIKRKLMKACHGITLRES